ncbi:FtsB family cell division protein [Porphyromonas sp. COT-108 OH2963]|uniref:FtsB family cell division protein n=1 Tax=Porphyromonas sp. COT-108 OH2963 TaxID=1515614 RepID=UPI00068B0011|nr:septum formation initiator family protein [Porphyromonas sp. COT-108 OH2963]
MPEIDIQRATKIVRKISGKITPGRLFAILIALFLLWPSDDNLYNQMKYYDQINELEREKAELQKQIATEKEMLEELQFDKSELERFARETFLMKAPNEDLYIIDREKVKNLSGS